MYKFNFYHTRPENFFHNAEKEQTKGLIGYLRGDFGKDGKGTAPGPSGDAARKAAACQIHRRGTFGSERAVHGDAGRSRRGYCVRRALRRGARKRILIEKRPLSRSFFVGTLL